MQTTPTRAANTMGRAPWIMLWTGAAVSCAIWFPVAAQDASTGGLLWNFTISQGLVSETNPGLERPDAPTESFARTDLGFDLSTTTRTSSLTFSGSGALEYGDVEPNGFKDPRLALSYSQDAARSTISTDVFFGETDVDDLAFEVGQDKFGNPTLISRPDTGTRQQYGGGLSYEWGVDGPVGATATLRRVETEYVDTTDQGLVDSTRDSASLSLRFDLNRATTLTVRGSTSRLDEVGSADTSDTDIVGVSLVFARPDGNVNLSAQTTDTADGTRTQLLVGRSYDLPTGELDAQIGIEESAFDGTGVTGSVEWTVAGPASALSFGLEHGITQDSRDAETRRTNVTVGLEQLLSDRLTGTVDLAVRDSETTQTGVGTLTASLSAGVSYALTSDWSLAAEATHRIEDQDGSDRADSTRVSLSISRAFAFRP